MSLQTGHLSVVQQTNWPWTDNIESKTHRVTSVKNQNKIVREIDAKFSQNTMFYATIAIKRIFSMHKRSSGPSGNVEN